MVFVSEPSACPPEQFLTPLQEKVYQTLEELKIPYQRVTTGEAITMEDCMAID